MWAHIPTSVSPQVAECSTSELTSEAAERLAPSCMWSGSHRRSQYLQREWSKVAYSRHLFGPTCEPSIVQGGVEKWMDSLAAIRASRSRTRGSEPAKISKGLGTTIRATYGQRSSSSSRPTGQDGASSRMWEHIFGSDTSISSSLPLSDLVSTSKSRSVKRLTLARLTGESGCSSSRWIVPYESRQDVIAKKVEQILWFTPTAQFENLRARQWEDAERSVSEAEQVMDGMPEEEVAADHMKARKKIRLGRSQATTLGSFSDQIGLHAQKMQEAGLSIYQGIQPTDLLPSIRIAETLMGWPAGWASEDKTPFD